MRRFISLVRRNEQLRFVLTGAVNTVNGYLFFVLYQALLGSAIGYIGSLLLAHVSASMIAFALYRRFVFRVEGSVVLDFVRFQGVYVVPLLANLIALPLIVEGLGWNVYLAQAVITLISVIVTYVGHKFFSFRRVAEAHDIREPIVWWRREWLVYAASIVLSSGAAVLATELWRANLRVPFVYSGDAVVTATQLKTVLSQGWYEHEPLLGAPAGQFFNDFSTAEHTGYLFAKLLAPFTNDPILIMNLWYLLGFPLAAITATWFLRLLKVSAVNSVLLATLFAIAPYHFARGEVHIWLSSYFAVPLGLGLVWFALRGEPLWGMNRARTGWAALLTGRTVFTVISSLLLAMTAAYYGLFIVILIAVIATARWVMRRQWRPFLQAAGAASLIAATMFANMLPDILYARATGGNPDALVRPPGGTEYYSVKLTALLLPTPIHRVPFLASVRDYYERLFPVQGESPALGAVAAFGLLALLAIAVVATIGLRRRAAAGEGSTWSTLRGLAGISLVAFLFATVGGFSSIIGLLTASIRGWNRISIVLAMLALAAVGLLLDAALRRASARWRPIARWRAPLAIVTASAVLLVGYLDQVVPAVAAPDYAAIHAEFDSDAEFVRSIEDRWGAGAMIVQLPYREFPESGSSTGVPDSDQLKWFLHSDTLRWTAGGIKGRAAAEWVRALEAMPADELVAAAAATGASAILIDQRAIPQPDPDDDAPATDLVADLEDRLGPPVLEAHEGRYLVFDLTEERARVEAVLGQAETEKVGAAVVGAVRVVFQPRELGLLTGLQAALSRFEPRLEIDNPRDDSVEVVVELTIASTTGPQTLEIAGADGPVVFRVDDSPTTVTIPLRVDPGRSTVDFTQRSGEAWPARNSAAVFSDIDVAVVDPALQESLGRVVAR